MGARLWRAFYVPWAVLSLAAAGCVATVGVGLGPTVDTRGGIGVEAQLRLGYGLDVDRLSPSFPLSLRLGTGSMDAAHQPYVLVGGDVPITFLLRADGLMLRGAVGVSSRRLFDATWLVGPSLAFGAAGRLHGGFSGGSHGWPSGHLLLLGGELRFDYLFGSGLDRGVFSLPLVLDFYTLCIFWDCGLQ